MNDCFDTLATLYVQGDQAALIKKMLPHPDASYDSLQSKHPAFRYLVNYWDALFFSSLVNAHTANQEAEFQLKSIHSEINHPLLKRLEDEAIEIKKAYEHPMDSAIPLAPLMNRLLEARPELLPLSNYMAKRDQIPLYPLPRELTLPLHFSIPDRPTLLIFEDWFHLVQCQQFSEISNALLRPENSLLLLDKYPTDLLRGQKADSIVFLSPHRRLHEAIPLLTKALDAFYAESRTNWETESTNADWFFRIAERVLCAIRQEKYGTERTPALAKLASNLSWFSHHKGIPGEEFDLGPAPINYFPDILKELSQHRIMSTRRIHVTHITPQIIDDKHAPSNLLENLLIHSNKAKFSSKVIVTERLVMHGKEYPYSDYNSASSTERSKNRLQKLAAAGFQVHIYSNMQTYLEKAHTIAKELQDSETDIAIFHGPDIINTMAAQLVPSPLRVLFEHGTPPSYPGFDLMIASTIDAQSRYQDLLEGFKMHIESLPFCIDLRKTWPKDPPTIESLELPPGCLAMTTISNHLSARISSEMCQAIATILQRVPNAFYAPMGKITGEGKTRLLKTFEGLGVAHRVKFLGGHVNPSHIARCMKLYLNEFPFGSCIGMLDAMASGCVVVSMYDPHGPSQARYGADFMGLDRVISTNRVEDYADLAIRLLTDPNMYKEWSEHTLKQYEKHANEVEYVQKFEEILLKYFKP
jgi:hypothetical protein